MQKGKKEVCIGTIGSGYAAYLHGDGFEKVTSVGIRLKTACDLDSDRAHALKNRYGYERTATDYEELLRDPEIDIIDIVTPPYLHPDMIIKAMQAGKHVICEKPLVGYYGQEADKAPIGHTVKKSFMYRQVIQTLDEIRAAIKQSGKKFMYAENFVYATPIRKTAQIIRAKKSKILLMRGEECVHGPISQESNEWKFTGGGTLFRIGCHPLTGMLWLKQQEAIARGEQIAVKSVVADTGALSKCLTDHEHRYLTTWPNDVEDFGTLIATFNDGTKMIALATDIVQGGAKNYIECFCNDNTLQCNITPNDLLNTYLLDEEGMDKISLSPRLHTKTGWNKAFVSDSEIRGFLGELEDFVEAVAYDREPESNFELAYDTTRILYAAYISMEEGRRVDLSL